MLKKLFFFRRLATKREAEVQISNDGFAFVKKKQKPENQTKPIIQSSKSKEDIAPTDDDQSSSDQNVPPIITTATTTTTTNNNNNNNNNVSKPTITVTNTNTNTNASAKKATRSVIGNVFVYL